MTFQHDLFLGRKVVIIGGTTGIGAATATGFADLGADVAVCGLGKNELSKNIDVTVLNVLEENALQDYLGGFQHIDILVNVIGISRDREEWQKKSFDEVMAINLTAVMDSCRLAQPKIATGGSIINIASMYSTFGAADRPAYAASKGAIVQLTKSLAIEYAKRGIRVNAVAPGWIITPLSAELFANASVADPILASIPTGRWGNAVDVADAIIFLASDAARYITGISLPVDGGYLTT